MLIILLAVRDCWVGFCECVLAGRLLWWVSLFWCFDWVAVFCLLVLVWVLGLLGCLLVLSCGFGFDLWFAWLMLCCGLDWCFWFGWCVVRSLGG